MPNTTRNADSVSMASVAHVHSQACQYTDARIEALHRHFNEIHATMHRESARRETKTRRLKLIDRCAFLLLGAIVTKVLDAAVLPALAVFCLGLSPDLGREVFEFFRKI